jgi:hypothetical protein
MSWMPSDDPVLGDPKTCCGEKTDVQAKQSSQTSPIAICMMPKDASCGHRLLCQRFSL